MKQSSRSDVLARGEGEHGTQGVRSGKVVWQVKACGSQGPAHLEKKPTAHSIYPSPISVEKTSVPPHGFAPSFWAFRGDILFPFISTTKLTVMFIELSSHVHFILCSSYCEVFSLSKLEVLDMDELADLHRWEKLGVYKLAYFPRSHRK
jgi:hypothetical protein